MNQLPHHHSQRLTASPRPQATQPTLPIPASPVYHDPAGESSPPDSTPHRTGAQQTRQTKEGQQP